jgi:hypothetical protein
MRKILLVSYILLHGGVCALLAQTPTDELLMKKHELCVAAIYDHGQWSQYWEGAYLRGNENIGTLTRQAAMPMIAFGITGNLNLLLATPYIKTHSTGGQLAGVDGFQDITFALKYQFWNREIFNGKLSVYGTAGFATPMTNYLSDYQPYSIGLGTNEGSLRGIAHYQFNNGIYVRNTAARLWRGTTEVERDYYYNNGSYYTRHMDVPDAWTYAGSAGVWLFDYALRVEATYQVFKCLTGDDIRAYNSPQPTNKVEVEQIGFFAQYFFKKDFLKGFGVLANASQMINGRNMGKFTNVGGGVTYQFNMSGSK